LRSHSLRCVLASALLRPAQRPFAACHGRPQSAPFRTGGRGHFAWRRVCLRCAPAVCACRVHRVCASGYRPAVNVSTGQLDAVRDAVAACWGPAAANQLFASYSASHKGQPKNGCSVLFLRMAAQARSMQTQLVAMRQTSPRCSASQLRPCLPRRGLLRGRPPCLGVSGVIRPCSRCRASLAVVATASDQLQLLKQLVKALHDCVVAWHPVQQQQQE
jgi:hypothetical protein